jgi:excisionase family DNA binding protein
MIALDELRGRLFLTVTEVASITDTDPRTVRRAIDQGDIPARRIGRNVRIPAATFWPQVCGLDPETLRPLALNSETGPASPVTANDSSLTKEPRHAHGLAPVPSPSSSTVRPLRGM